MLSTQYLILKDLYSLTSLFFIKGIVDANCTYDPVMAEDLADRDDSYSTFATLDGEWGLDDYLTLEVIPLCSEYKLFNVRNFLIYSKKPKIKQAVCHLLDYLYREGIKNNRKHTGANYSRMLTMVQPNSVKFRCPKGEVPVEQWHDLLRRYVVLIRNAQGEDSVMDLLNEYIAIAAKDKKEKDELRNLENERRAFILSGESSANI